MTSRREFYIEDQYHCERLGQFETEAAAREELRRLAEVPWDEPPNRAPCMSWRTCGRRFLIYEFGYSHNTRQLLNCRHVLDISAEGIVWVEDDEK